MIQMLTGLCLGNEKWCNGAAAAGWVIFEAALMLRPLALVPVGIIVFLATRLQNTKRIPDQAMSDTGFFSVVRSIREYIWSWWSWRTRRKGREAPGKRAWETH